LYDRVLVDVTFDIYPPEAKQRTLDGVDWPRDPARHYNAPTGHRAKDPDADSEDLFWIYFSVLNHGSRPTTVNGIGIGWSVFANEYPGGEFRDAGREILRQTIVLTDPLYNESVAPDKPLAFTYGMRRPLGHVDTTIRAWAAHGRRGYAWSKPQVFYRGMLGPRFPKDPVDQELLEPVAAPLKAAPVEARWKLWKPAHTRKTLEVPNPYLRDR
jgi:hypothetical protein